MSKFFAHSLEGRPVEEWQPLEEHLLNVAKLAAKFAKPFSGEEWARIAGLLHDLGKGTLAWQAYLRFVNKVVDEFAKFNEGHPNHAVLGAKQVYKRSQEAGKLLAYCIAGHHVGLPDWNGSRSGALETKLQQRYPEVAFSYPPPELPEQIPFSVEPGRFGFQLQFFVRMLFSCLVDADFLDTEAFLDKSRHNWRSGYPPIEQLTEIFWNNFNELRRKADRTTNVNQQREKVLQDCIRASDLSPGLFSLTVPTGGGKTLASMAFALNHAKKFGKCRIIYVIPFTSIIEQNAKVFRDMLGEDAVLEHHCNFIADDSDWKSRLATENWDAPVVVTTNVQFFDSFYANRTSKCRKLHNVAESIIIFDEVQAIPVEKLKPCLEIIKELSLNYGVTSVLCTATQPAIEYSERFTSGLKDVTEIIQDVPSLFSALKRTKEEFVGGLNDVEEVAKQLLEFQQVLCIVNTRQHALDIFSMLPNSAENIHLSALMYPAHRTKKLDEIRQRLKDGRPCRVVSTQLIEAGVDVDFPCVFREITGIDSIAQAAGRCNRNGLIETPCPVNVFELSGSNGCAFFRLAAQSAAKLFGPFEGELTSPDCVGEYFEDYFWKNEQRMDMDGIVKKCLQGQSGDIQFRELAEFRMIKSASIPVVVALENEAEELVKSLSFVDHKGRILRKLQQYMVQIYPYQLDELRGWFDLVEPGVWVLHSDELYSDKTGLKCKIPEANAFFG